MVVYNKTSITSEEAEKILVKSTKIDYSKKFLFALFLIAAGVPIMVLGFANNNTIYITFGAIFIAFAIVLTGFNLVQFTKIPKVVREKNQEACEYGVNYDFRFKEHSVYLIVSANDRKNKYEYTYDQLKRIYEYEDKYEIKFVNNVTLYVDKAGFENKKMEEFFRKNIQTSKKKIKLRK